MNRFTSFIVSILLIVSLTACQSKQSENTDTTMENTTIKEEAKASYPEEILNVDNFRCVYFSVTDEANIIIDGDKAKDIYTYLSDLEKEETSDTFSNEYESISLYFTSGEFIDENGEAIPSLGDAYHGYYCLNENDFAYTSASPLHSSSITYQFPDGTYENLLNML